MRILVTGASGSGTSTLGRALATARASQHFETDDFFWLPTDPPFEHIRPQEEREALMEALFVPRRDWVLSGSPLSWGQNAVQRATHIVMLELATQARLARVEARARVQNIKNF